MPDPNARIWVPVRGGHDRPARTDSALGQGVGVLAGREAKSPTAMHTRASGHEIPASPVPPAPAGLVAVWRPQESTRPNQRMTRGEVVVAPLPLGTEALEKPTAVQVRLRGHETARRLSSSETEGFGVDCTCQPLASQRSASGLKLVWSYSVPTAVQARSPEQETDTSQPFATSGLGWIDQLVPFHTSTSGLVIPGGWSGSVDPSLTHQPRSRRSAAGKRSRKACSSLRRGGLGSASAARWCRPSARPPSSRSGVT